jgi:hypothetical protein
MPEEAGEPRLPGTDVVARYVGGAHVDSETGEINGSAFERNPKDVDGVSFTRRHIFDQDCNRDRDEIRRVVGSHMKFGKTAVFAELTVGNALEVLQEFEQDIFFVADPIAAAEERLANPAHALLVGFPFKDEQVGSLKSEIAGDRLRLCVTDRFPAIVR